METSIALEKILVQYFESTKHRIDFIARFVLSLIQVKKVVLSEIATSLNGNYEKDTNYKRIQRFMSGYSFDVSEVARFVLEQIPKQEGLVLSLDRTNWKFGKKNINIMAIGAAHRGTAFNLMWTLLDKQGNSNQDERIAFIKRILTVIPSKTIRALVADREFIGAKWFKFLNEQNLKFHIRIRKNMLADTDIQGQHFMKFFVNLPVNEPLTLHKRYLIAGQYLSITGMKLRDGDYLIIVTNANPKDSLKFYKQRWEIETFFKAIKKTGFDFEATHLTHLDRISNLLALVTIAFTWAHRMGEFLNDNVKAIKIKNHGYRALSFFRHGCDYLRSIINHYSRRLDDFYLALTVLTCR